MAYRNKVYVAFDGDNDIKYYRTMKLWNANSNHDFDFNDAHDLHSARDSSKEESIKASLRDRLINSKVFVLLLGEHTKNLYKFVRWEIEEAIKLKMPIIVANLNGHRSKDIQRMPAILNGVDVTVVPFKEVDLINALKKLN